MSVVKKTLDFGFLFPYICEAYIYFKQKDNQMGSIIQPNQKLAKSTIKVAEELNRIEALERANYETSDSIELLDGRVLSREAQLEFFKRVYRSGVGCVLS